MIREVKRKNIRLEAKNYLGQRLYFITLCCTQRRPLLARPAVATWFVEKLRLSAARYGFEIHAYCVMPDHLHFLAEGVAEASNLLQFVASFKQTTAFEFQRRWAQRLWQFKYFDHILRKADALESVAWYIWMNPARKGLCQTAQKYRYSGSFTAAGTKLFLGSRRGNWSPPWNKASPSV